MALGAAALITAAGLTACGDDEDTSAAATDTGASASGASGGSGSAALEEASTLISENTDLICMGPAVFDGDDVESLSCVWDYNEGIPPEDVLSEVMLWTDEDVPDQEATLEANHNRPGGMASAGVELDWTQFEASADMGGYVEADGARGVCTGGNDTCADLANELGWTFKSNGEISTEMQAYSGWDNLQEARDAIREKLDIPCSNLNAPTGEAAQCGTGVLAFDLSVDDLEDEGLFEGFDRAEASKVEDGDWVMVCRNDNRENCDEVAEHTGQEVEAA